MLKATIMAVKGGLVYAGFPAQFGHTDFIQGLFLQKPDEALLQEAFG